MRSLASVASVLVVLAVTSIATAKPLPSGLAIKLVKGKVMATRGGTSVQVTSTKKLLGVELSDDGKTIVVKTPGNVDMGEDPEVTATYSLAGIEGRIANAVGMGFQVKKRYADAVAPFTTAVQQDPQPVYVTNLLSALSMGKQLDEADKVLGTYGKRIAPWLAWRLAVDKELAALVERPATKALFPGGGKATSKLNKEGDILVAYSPAGYAAVEVYTGLQMGDASTESTLAIAFVDLASGTEVLRLPTATECSDPDGGCNQKKYDPANKKQRKVADAILAQLGFLPGEPMTNFRETNTLAAKDGRKVIEVKGGGGAIVAGKTQIPLPDDLEIHDIAFVPKALVIVHKVNTVSNMDGMGMWELELTAIPTP